MTSVLSGSMGAFEKMATVCEFPPLSLTSCVTYLWCPHLYTRVGDLETLCFMEPKRKEGIH